MCVLFIPTGSLFAFLSFAESLTTNTSVAVFNSVYSATVAWYPTFVFMLAAILCLIPLIVLGYVYHASSAGRKITCLCVTSYLNCSTKRSRDEFSRAFVSKKSGAAALVCRQLTEPVPQGRCSKSVLYFQEINTEDFFPPVTAAPSNEKSLLLPPHCAVTFIKQGGKNADPKPKKKLNKQSKTRSSFMKQGLPSPDASLPCAWCVLVCV